MTKSGTRRSPWYIFFLTCLTFSRMFTVSVDFRYLFLYMVYEKVFYSKNLMLSFNVLWMGSNYFYMTCIICLHVFYFLDIANFSDPIFLWIKWKIHSVLLIIILGVMLLFCMYLLLKKILINRLIENGRKWKEAWHSIL